MFLLVVAADDGVMPQTREHLAILELLDVPAGVVALTKRDLVDDELAELARLSIDELLEDGPYAGFARSSRCPRAPARASRSCARRWTASRAKPAAGRRPATVRLPIDRTFTLRGIGTVVTGTLWSGTVRVGDRLAIEPGGRDVRVRSVQVHDHAVAERGARASGSRSHWSGSSGPRSSAETRRPRPARCPGRSASTAGCGCCRRPAAACDTATL